MAAILRLAVANPTATEFPNGVNIFSASTPQLVSVIAVNKTEDPQNFYVYTIPAGSEATPDEWGVICYNLPISAYNSYETFRFGMNPNDTIAVAGSAGMSYFVQGITQ